jgi:hypothetical protein
MRPSIMKIRHPARWILPSLVLFAIAAWFASRTFNPTTIARALWGTYSVGALVSLFAQSHRRSARPGLMTIVATLVAAIVGGWLLEVVDVRWWTRMLLMCVGAMPLMSVANAAYRADVRRAQRKREADAATLVRAVVAGQEVAPFALYLRPFVTTDRLIAQTLPSDLQPMDVPVHLDAETLLTRSLRRALPLIGLGRPGEMAEGIARVATGDAEWRQTVEALARRALFIVMVPLSRPSTTWELHWLAESGLIEKVLFIMPEVPHQAANSVWVPTERTDRIFDAGVRSFSAEAHMLDLPKEWIEASRVAREIGLAFPPLAAVGALFTIDSHTGVIKDILPLALSTLMRPLRYLRASMMRLGFVPASENEPLGFEQAFESAIFLGGRTCEFALTRAADGMVVWGKTTQAIQLLYRALDEGQPESAFVNGFIKALPTLIKERLAFGDLTAASRYANFAHQLYREVRLAPLLTSETTTAIDRLAEKLV